MTTGYILMTRPSLTDSVPTIGCEEEEGRAGLLDPADLVDFLFDFQALQVVKLGFVALKCAVDIVVTSEHWRRLYYWLALVYVCVCVGVCV